MVAIEGVFEARNSATDPDTIRMLIVAGVILVPLSILRGDPYIWRFAVLLGALTLIVLHPVLGIGLLVAVAAWRPIKFILGAFIAGLAGGIGARLSGVFGGAERAERQRERFMSRRDRSGASERTTRRSGDAVAAPRSEPSGDIGQQQLARHRR